MVRFQKFAKSSLALLLVVPALGVQVPAGTELHLRLKTRLASNASKVKDPVEAVVIAPVLVGDQFAIPAGAVLRGVVSEVSPAAPNQRAVISLALSQIDIGGKTLKLAATPAGIDNARESVNDAGQILGILASETLSARMDAGINRVAQRFPGLADLLGAAKSGFVKEAQPDIAYDPGVEFRVRLAQPLEIPEASPAPRLEPVANEAELVRTVVAQPFRTTAENPPKPSDIANLMFIGSEERLQRAFTEAGWSGAATLNAQSKLETFRAIVEQRGYKEAPVSILLLDGRPPDLVFQKMNNTFAMRHHLRIWRRPGAFQGQPVWVCAATHDIGIDFSEQNRTFIHKIDSNIDRERAKVVNDLLLTGQVKSLALVERPAVPRKSMNATGDSLDSDGRMAVLIF